MRRAAIVSFLSCVALSGVVTATPISPGFTTYFSTAECPEGWEALYTGRLVVPVANSSIAGVTVNDALADMEDRTHQHVAQTSFTLLEKDIAAIADDNHQAARHGTFPWTGLLEQHASGFPFLQLPLCRYRGSVGGGVGKNTSGIPTAGFGTIAHYSSDVQACPSMWAPSHEAAGRFLVPGYEEGGPVSNDEPALASGEDRTHNHTFALQFSTTDVSFAGVEGCCNDQPAATGEVGVAGASEPVSSGLPYVQLLTCVDQDETFDVSMPPGALLFHELRCPPGWSVVDIASGRFLVSLPSGGSPGASFGGDSLPSAAPSNPLHTHDMDKNVTLQSASVMLASGCCGGGYAGAGTYNVAGSSHDAAAGLPYTMYPLCEQTGDKGAAHNQLYSAPHADRSSHP